MVLSAGPDVFHADRDNIGNTALDPPALTSDDPEITQANYSY